jgi:hypothetical protein
MRFWVRRVRVMVGPGRSWPKERTYVRRNSSFLYISRTVYAELNKSSTKPRKSSTRSDALDVIPDSV